MDPIYETTINSMANDIDNLWHDKHAFSSLNSNANELIHEENSCSYKRFMISSKRSSSDDTSLGTCKSDVTKRSGSSDLNSMTITERLAKTASIWTLPNTSRMQADKILHEFYPGIFLVRMTTDKKTMVLSYRMNDKAQHVLIRVDLKNGFYMDGSHHVFRNVNLMIAHYMKHPIQNPDLCLKLPRALMEAYDSSHFQYFENMKINFWTTNIAKKSIDDIWSKPISASKSKSDLTDPKENVPALPPRVYLETEINIIQGMAEVPENETYQIIPKKINPQHKQLPEIPQSLNSLSSLPNPPLSANVTDDKINAYIHSEVNYSEVWKYNTNLAAKVPQNLVDLDNEPSIQNIIKIHFPQIINVDVQFDSITSTVSLTDKVLKRNKTNDSKQKAQKKVGQTLYVGQYEIPWDIKNEQLANLLEANNLNMAIDNFGSKENLLKDDKQSPYTDFGHSNLNLNCLNEEKVIDHNSSTDDEDDNISKNENRLQLEFLGAMESVIYSPLPNNQAYTTNKTPYGQGIRSYLMSLCSERGISDISKLIRQFIKCTQDRSDLNPYTTMRLIRQYMSGLKNLLTKNKDTFGINNVINIEIIKTPKNVFINLDSIIESVLAKSVLKPLSGYVYSLLVLEHYKNNNLKLIAGGVEMAKSISPDKLGLTENSKSMIDSKLDTIRLRFQKITKQYSPEKKMKHMLAIVDIVFNMVKLIYTTVNKENKQIDFKSNHILPLFVYIFSQCKMDAVSAQCEFEYVEGLIWLTKLANGEPGFFLLNLMSALEAIKVLARPKLNPSDVIDLSDSNSGNHLSLSNAAVGSVNVIIIDEKMERFFTKSVPVRSTVTVGSLCNTISHRLGIFNPKDYSLYLYTESEETLLRDHESPLIIKTSHQQKTGESVNFLFKRKNANLILSSNVSVSTTKRN